MPNDEESISKIMSAMKKTTGANLEGFKNYALSLGGNKEVRLYTSSALTSDDIDFMIQWINRLDLKRENQENDKV